MRKSEKENMFELYCAGIMNADPLIFESVCGPDFVFSLPQPAVGARKMNRADALVYLTTAPGSFLDTKTITFDKINVAETVTDYVVELNVMAKLVKGGDYNNMLVLWFKFKDGKISECHEHLDTSYALRLMR